jgi:hypothetical protein
VLSNYTLQAYFDASLLISPLPISPELEQSWKNAETQILDNLTECETDGNLVDSELLRDFADTLKIINENEPRFLRQRGFPKRYAVFLTRLTAEMKEELRASPIFDESSELRSEAERLETIAQTLTDLSGFVEEDSVGLLELSSKLTSAADDLKQNCRDAESSEPEYDETRETTPSESFDISALFSDL